MVDCYTTVLSCTNRAINLIMLRFRAKKLQLFIAAGPLAFVSKDILEMLTTRRSKSNLLVIPNRYSELVRTVSIEGKSVPSIAKAFGTH